MRDRFQLDRALMLIGGMKISLYFLRKHSFSLCLLQSRFMIPYSLLEGCVIREGPCSVLAVRRVMAPHPRQSYVLRQLKKSQVMQIISPKIEGDPNSIEPTNGSSQTYGEGYYASSLHPDGYAKAKGAGTSDTKRLLSKESDRGKQRATPVVGPKISEIDPLLTNQCDPIY